MILKSTKTPGCIGLNSELQWHCTKETQYKNIKDGISQMAQNSSSD